MAVVRAVAVALVLAGAGAFGPAARAAGEAGPTGHSTGVAPGAIEPQPVNRQLEEEFVAEVAEHTRRGAAVVPPAETWEMRLVPALHAGMVGWCAVLRGSAASSARCPVSPLEGPRVLYEAWEGGPSATRGYALTAGNVSAVTVNGAKMAVATQPISGLTVSLGAAVVTIPAPYPWIWPDEIDGVVGGFSESPHSGWGGPSLSPSLTLATTSWQAPQAPPPAPCEISAGGLRGLRRRAGRVVPMVTPLDHVAGRGLLSCADSEYSFAGSTLDAAILLDAAEPGVTPVPLPDATPVHRHPGLYSAPGWKGEILGRRSGGAWLLLEGGASTSQRERVLAHLHARAGS
jgi:hypothetical protein